MVQPKFINSIQPCVVPSGGLHCAKHHLDIERIFQFPERFAVFIVKQE